MVGNLHNHHYEAREGGAWECGFVSFSAVHRVARVAHAAAAGACELRVCAASSKFILDAFTGICAANVDDVCPPSHGSTGEGLPAHGAARHISGAFNALRAANALGSTIGVSHVRLTRRASVRIYGACRIFGAHVRPGKVTFSRHVRGIPRFIPNGQDGHVQRATCIVRDKVKHCSAGAWELLSPDVVVSYIPTGACGLRSSDVVASYIPDGQSVPNDVSVSNSADANYGRLLGATGTAPYGIHADHLPGTRHGLRGSPAGGRRRPLFQTR